MRRLPTYLSIAIVLAACLACVPQETEGERSSTGDCPDPGGCSSATPMGLTFTLKEPPHGQYSALRGIALDGETSVLVHGLPASAEASSSNAARLAVLELSGSLVRLRGDSLGSARLLLTDDEGLLDRVAITVERVASMDLQPLEDWAPGGLYLRNPAFDGSWALMLPSGVVSRLQLGVRLVSPTGESLVDETFEFGGDALVEQSDWQSAEFNVRGGEDLVLTLGRRAGVVERTITTVEGVDDVRYDRATTFFGELPFIFHCLTATSGGTSVHGPGYTFTDAEGTLVDGPNCTTSIGDWGEEQFTVEVGGVEAHYTVSTDEEGEALLLRD